MRVHVFGVHVLATFVLDGSLSAAENTVSFASLYCVTGSRAHTTFSLLCISETL